MSLDFDRQVTKLYVSIALMNGCTAFGSPVIEIGEGVSPVKWNRDHQPLGAIQPLAGTRALVAVANVTHKVGQGSSISTP